MRQTFFYIPHSLTLGGNEIPLFGWGLLAVVWGVIAVAILAFMMRRHGFDREVKGVLPLLLVVEAAIIFLLPNLEVTYGTGDNAIIVGLPIRGYGVMLLAGVVSGVALAAWRARRMGLDPELIFSLAFWMFLAGIVGARAFYVIQKWETYRTQNLRELVWNVADAANGGLVVYGSVIGGLAAAFIFLHRHKLPALAIADLIAPSMVLGLALGRLGCLMNGCCYGGACDLPWAVSFPEYSSPYQEDPSPPYYDHLRSGWLHGVRIEPNAQGWPYVTAVVPGSEAAKQLDAPTDEAGRLTTPWKVLAVNGRAIQTPRPAQEGRQAVESTPMEQVRMLVVAGQQALHLITEEGGEAGWTLGTLPTVSRPVHPTQIYSSLNAFLLCALLLAVYPYRRRDGEVMALLVVLYGITRFLLEMIRTDEGAIFGTGLTISQNVSLLMIAGAVLVWLLFIRRQPVGKLALPPKGTPVVGEAKSA